jgi:PAS domain S-box-containing protein
MEKLDPEVVLRMAAQAPDAIVIIDNDGLIRYWNRGAERIFGYPASEVIGTTLEVVIPERLRQRHRDGFMAAMARGTTKYGEADLLAVPAIAADGRTVSIEFSVALLSGPDGAVHHVGAIIRDVTEKRSREQELRRRLGEPRVPSPPVRGVS